MKKGMSLFIIFVLLPLAGICQTKVKGISVNSTLTEFKLAMKQKGYKGKAFNKEQFRYNKIDFADFKNCILDVNYNTSTDSILSVSIRFPQAFVSKDYPLPININTFGELKEQLETKYGQSKEERNEYPDKNKAEPSFNIICTWLDNVNTIRLIYWDFGSGKYTLERPRSFVMLDYHTNASEKKEITVNPDL